MLVLGVTFNNKSNYWNGRNNSDTPSAYNLGINLDYVYNGGFPTQYGYVITFRAIYIAVQFFISWNSGSLYYRSNNAESSANSWGAWVKASNN